MKELINKYFISFSNKDIDKLSDMFSEEIILQDWDIHFEGKTDVLKANKNIFDQVKNISINLNELYIFNDVAVCLIEITINNIDKLKVIDIIKVNNAGKIIEISAYKQ